MKPEAQEILLEIPEQAAPAPLVAVVGVVPAGKPKLKPIDWEQGLLRPVIVDELVPPDHKARAIWDLTGQLDLSRYFSKIRSKEGKAGSPAWHPQLLLSVWLYAYSEQMTSAREVARVMEYEPGLMWLSGLGEVNYHKLSEFRAEYPEELKELMGELLGTLHEELAGAINEIRRLAHGLRPPELDRFLRPPGPLSPIRPEPGWWRAGSSRAKDNWAKWPNRALDW